MPGKSKDVRAGGAHVELGVKDRLKRGLARAGARLKKFGRSVATTGAQLTASGAAIVAPFVLAIRHFAKFGDQLDKMSQRTGIAAPALAELGFAAEQSGQNLDTIEKSVRRMQKTIGDADRGLSTAVDGLDKLGLSARQLQGQRPEDQFQTIADRVAAIEDPTKRASAAMDVFGSRTGTAILPMLENMRALRAEARDLGLVPTEEEVKKAAAVTDALNRLKRVFEATLFAVGAQLADVVLQAAFAIQKILKSIQDWARNNAAVLQTILAVGVALMAAGAILTAVGGTIVFVGFVLSALATIVGAILSPVGLVIGAIVALGAALVIGARHWLLYSTRGREVGRLLKDTFDKVLGTVRAALGGIFNAIKAGNLALAGKIAFTGLRLAALQGLNALRSLVGDTITNIIGQLINGDLTGAWETMTQGLAALWDQLAQHLPKSFQGAFTSIVGMWKKLTKSLAKTLLTNPALKKLFGIDKEEKRFTAAQQKQRENLRKLYEKGQLSPKDRQQVEAGTHPALHGQSFQQDLLGGLDEDIDLRFDKIEKFAARLDKGIGDPNQARRSQEELEKHNRAAAAKLADGTEDLQRHFDELLKQAQTEADQAAAERAARLNTASAAAAGAVEKASAVFSSGTFSAAQAARFGAVSRPAEKRIADATEETADNTGKMVKSLRNRKPATFTA